MAKPRPKKERLVKLLELAQTYRGWSQRELARELERDPHNMVPDGGVPRLDLVLRLSEALDWPVDTIVEDLCGEDAAIEASSRPRGAARSFNEAARARLMAGAYTEAAILATEVVQGGFDSADTAYALNILANALEGQGRYTAAADAARRGLRLVDPLSADGLSFRSLLANLHYSLGDAHEAEGMATSLIVDVGEPEPGDLRRHYAGYARYVRGSCCRVLAGTESASRTEYAQRAVRDLDDAASILDGFAAWGGNVNDAATASICRGGAIEMRVLLGDIPIESAISEFESALDDTTSGEESTPWWLEARGWWCVFACNAAVRHLRDDRQLERVLAVFTNKADEIAESLGHWALRERVWAIEHVWRRVRDTGELHGTPWNLDAEEIRNLAGTMGRFPVFRETGWQILQKVRLEGGVP